MEEQQISALLTSSARFSPPPGLIFSYGTAGFRANGSILASTVFRGGILAALRSLKTGATVGMMITASHNPVDDNGVKIADPSGGMMTQQWEPFADALVNAQNPHELVKLVIEFVKKEKIPFGGLQSAEILLGRDTRPSGEYLLDCAKQGIGAIIGAVAINMGILTTPQLHWMVRCRNKGLKASESDYLRQLSNSFRRLLELNPKGMESSKENNVLLVDAANGVGEVKLQELKVMITGIDLHVRNSGKEGVLNDGVGADFVQKEKVVPHGFGSDDVGMRCASLDGDADRLVFFRVISADDKKIDLVDGDKILSLFALFIKEQLNILNKPDKGSSVSKQLDVKLGVVQTAYANGASTDYLRALGLEVEFTPTGVKYLHEKASEFDIGIYFEANGHGTIVFSDSLLHTLDFKVNEPNFGSSGSEHEKAVQRLFAVSQLINQAVGDALSGLLLVEAILKYMGWSIEDWSKLYQDLPSRQMKVKVADRTAIVTTNAERQVARPSGLQEMINSETANYSQGRCFVRPSGTEDVVRVYAEASTQEAADALAQSVAQHVSQFLGS